MINSPTETVVDIVLDVLENFHENFCIKVLSKVVACQQGVCQLFRIKIFPQVFITERSFLEVFYKSNCSTLINTVKKYLNFRSSGAKVESVTCKFTKNRSSVQVFFEEFHYKRRTAILKNASRWLFLGTTLFWKYSWMATSQRQL